MRRANSQKYRPPNPKRCRSAAPRTPSPALPACRRWKLSARKASITLRDRPSSSTHEAVPLEATTGILRSPELVLDHMGQCAEKCSAPQSHPPECAQIHPAPDSRPPGSVPICGGVRQSRGEGILLRMAFQKERRYIPQRRGQSFLTGSPQAARQQGVDRLRKLRIERPAVPDGQSPLPRFTTSASIFS